MELQSLSQPDELFRADKLTTWSQSLSMSKCRLLGSKTTENWKKALYLGSISTFVVLVLNVGFVLWAVANHGLQGDQAVLFTGNCEKSKQISTGFHLVINILGTVLLGASNYAMREVAGYWRAKHAESQSHSPYKALSLDLSGFFIAPFASHTLSVYKYQVLVGNKPFSSFNVNNVKLPGQNSPDTTFSRLLEKDRNGTLEYFNNSECISKYANGFQTNYANLLLVTDDYNSTIQDFGNFTDHEPPETDPYRWICAGYGSAVSDCSSLVSELLADPDNWAVPATLSSLVGMNFSLHSTDLKVKYCLSESVPERCTVEYSLPLIIVVIISNIIKIVILCWITITMAETPILTTGDAISSFIKIPDDTTRGQCLLSRDVVIKPVNESLRFDTKPRRWGSPVSGHRWAICLLSYSIAILVCVSFLVIGVAGRGSGIWAAGLGEPNISNLIVGLPSSLVANTIIANIPQVVFSILYFSSNGIYTIMALANEWSYHALKRKGLRVSTLPRGSQRSTYFLSLPYRYSLPLLTFSGILHWLISQSLYLVSIKSYGIGLTREPADDTTTCGYSPAVILSTLSVGVAMLVCLVLMSFKRLKSGMPVAGSCSLAIAAACHPSLSGGDAMEEIAGIDDTLPLQWGVEMPECDGIGHCALSSGQVEFALDGSVYE
ncbi:hypothetical protein PENFLA_c024G04793 [Penicillium flavigenum]|uniref:DUF6536 domain-containing protein n=1 Tax=Penicillium flavigenum TaxID=254877 RepID=A0A1V6SUW0_9EURO|nr:hypothetical protein PENFLA_c024G04793 [Penicillium flavigenum]